MEENIKNTGIQTVEPMVEEYPKLKKKPTFKTKE